MAISCPFGGEDQRGLVYIYNGNSEGLSEKPSQVITGRWASGTLPASFGFALRGAKDLDMNGYPGEWCWKCTMTNSKFLSFKYSF